MLSILWIVVRRQSPDTSKDQLRHFICMYNTQTLAYKFSRDTFNFQASEAQELGISICTKVNQGIYPMLKNENDRGAWWHSG